MPDLHVVQDARTPSDWRGLEYSVFQGPSANVLYPYDALQDSIFLPTPDNTRESNSDLSWIKLAVFSGQKTEKHCYRADHLVTAITGAECDYDAGEQDVFAVLETLRGQGIRAIVYTTASFTQEKHRFRVLLPFAKKYVGGTDQMREWRKRAIHYAERVVGFPFARESYVLSQAYLYGNLQGREYHWGFSQGRCVDEMIDITEIPRVQPQAPLPPTSDFNLSHSVQQILTAESYHPPANSLFGHLAAQGVPEQTAIELVSALMRANGDGSGRCLDRLRDLPRCAADIYAKEAAKRAVGPESSRTLLDPQPFLPSRTPKSRVRLYGAYLYRHYITLINGRGGVSKSMFVMTIAVSLAIGRDLLGLVKEPIQRRRVLLLNNEDTTEELDLRLMAIVNYYALSTQEQSYLQDNLARQSGYHARLLLVAKQDKVLFPTALAGELGELLEAYDVAILDPLVSLHHATENSNEEVDVVVGQLRNICRRGGVGIVLCHHSNKANSTDADDSSRGASALVDGARVNLRLARMSKAEAESFVLAEGDFANHVRLDQGKANFSPPAADATWFKLQSVPVECLNEETHSTVTEHLGVPEPVELVLADTPEKATWSNLNVAKACIEAGITGHFFLTGATETALMNVLDAGSRSSLQRRFTGFPDAEQASAVNLPEGENRGVWKFWRVKNEGKRDNKTGYHIEKQ
ncbi:MAG: AAA family ATPase [Cyanobacteria bacterium P01_F01_bin.3]